MKITLKILCLEDDEEDFDIITYTLEKSGLSFTAKQVDTREKYLKALTEFSPDIILSDHALPRFSSTEALRISQEKCPEIPFILVTGAVSDEFAVSSIKLGADDYILKSNLRRLASAIENAIKHRETEKAKITATAELASQNKKLTKINKEVDSFVYSVSHNLRAPLMSVLGLITLAKQESDKETLDHYHELMESSVHKLDDTLKEILDYSRNARQELQNEQIDLRKLINDNIGKMQFMPGFNLLDIKVAVDDQIPFYSDLYRLSVIINNLISNGIKYLDEHKEKPFMDIAVSIDEEKAILKFEDNGIGIEKQLIPKIFNMFFRANNTKDGSGLGLYIVQEAIEKLRGKIEIESTIGKGTVFKLEIPNQLQNKKILEPTVSLASAVETAQQTESAPPPGSRKAVKNEKNNPSQGKRQLKTKH